MPPIITIKAIGVTGKKYFFTVGGKISPLFMDGVSYRDDEVLKIHLYEDVVEITSKQGITQRLLVKNIESYEYVEF